MIWFEFHLPQIRKWYQNRTEEYLNVDSWADLEMIYK